MSVRAYIIREKSIWVDEENNKIYKNQNDSDEDLKEYIHKSEEECIDIWSQDKLISEMLRFGANDYTNSEYVGLIEMDYKCFDDMILNHKLKFDDFDRDSLYLISRYFDEIGKCGVVKLHCY